MTTKHLHLPLVPLDPINVRETQVDQEKAKKNKPFHSQKKVVLQIFLVCPGMTDYCDPRNMVAAGAHDGSVVGSEFAEVELHL